MTTAERPERVSVVSGSPYESQIGFSRAVKVGNLILVSGTAPIWPDGTCDPDPSVQACRCWEIVQAALAELGAGIENIVRTRMYITDVGLAGELGAVHGQVFEGIRPASTMVVVAGLLDPRWVIEVEADATV